MRQAPVQCEIRKRNLKTKLQAKEKERMIGCQGCRRMEEGDPMHQRNKQTNIPSNQTIDHFLAGVIQKTLSWFLHLCTQIGHNSHHPFPTPVRSLCNV